jgi:hypothetical protein
VTAEGDPTSAEEKEGRKPPTGTPEPPGKDPGDRTGEPPHHALNNPVTDPDPTEWPDPYEKRPDPRGPDEEHEGGPRPPSTSEPPPPIGTDQVRAGEDDYPRSGKGRRQ